MRMKTGLKLIPLLLAMLWMNNGSAQKSATFTSDIRLYNEALDLFHKEKFAAAKFKFEEYIALEEDPNAELRVTSQFYSGVCSLYLFHKDAEYVLEAFMQEYPESPWKGKVYYELATYNYRKKSYRKALDWFKYVDPDELNDEEVMTYNFQRGHSYFMRKNYTQAPKYLVKVKDSETKYALPATYFYSHVMYDEGNFQTALDGFLRLEDNPDFGPVVPYYITQIYYKQERYDEVLAFAPALLEGEGNDKTKRKEEIARLLGDAYYREDRFEEAAPYLEYYHAETTKYEREPSDFYQLGFTYYNSGRYADALDQFAQCSNDDSELGQSATYYMGDCYLKLDQKEYARTAFKEASESDFNQRLKEDALFNYAKLAYELSYNPFHEAITAIEAYLEEFPNSVHREEAYEFLLNVYMKSRNYEAALRSLDKLDKKDTRTKEAYQVVAFNRAVELYQQKNYPKASEYFDKVSTYPVNQTLIAEAKFWKAELAYRSGEYAKAYSLYTDFLIQPGSVNSGMFNAANYGAGYARFKQKDYAGATQAFRKYVDQHTGDDFVKKNDALIRLGDCYYVIKDYDKAISYYDKAANMNQGNKDYALFQKAVCYGLDGQGDKKIFVLNKMLDEQGGTPYTPDAKFELAETYRLQDDLMTARGYYRDIVQNHSKSPYRKVSLRNLILVAVRTGKNTEAVEYWNSILADYPNDPIRTDAYRIVEDVLIAEEIEIPDDLVAEDELEVKVFQAARDFALSEDCNKAVEKLSRYLEKYQPATYGIEANYYLGNCYFELGNKTAALTAFNFVVTQPVSDYTEECLIAAATINYNNENWDIARNHYQELEIVARSASHVLEAEIGLMRTYFKLGQGQKAREYADKVLANPGTPDDIKKTAFLWRGKVLYEADDWDNAYYDFVEVAKIGGLEGAEAKYFMARIAYNKGAYKACEKEVFELIEKFASFNEWKYKGFLLLADTYIALEDYFQARATCDAILENVSEPWVIDGCQERLKRIDALDQPEGEAPEEEEINFGQQ